MALWALSACGEERAPGFGSTPTAGSNSVGGAVSGGSGGTPARAGAPSEAGQANVGGRSGSGGNEPAGDAGAGGDANESPPSPLDEPCAGDRAFVALSSAFIAPTPEPLSLALNRLTYDASPITVVLRANGAEPTIATSYTKLVRNRQEFPAALIPEFPPAWVASGGFGTVSAQTEGWLLVTVDTGPLEIPLQNISVFAATRDSCTQAVLRLSATIHQDHADLVETIVGIPSEPEPEPEEEEPEMPDQGDTEEVPIQALFSLELVDFNFQSLP